MPRRSVTPFLRGRTYSALIPRPSGRGKGRSLGTADVKTAEKISRFLMWLREQGEWYLLDKLADGSANPTEAFAAHTLVNLPTYIQTLKNGPIVVVDIEPYVKKWIAEMKRIRSPADDTRKRYVGHVQPSGPVVRSRLCTSVDRRSKHRGRNHDRRDRHAGTGQG